MYDPAYIAQFYDDYGEQEWERLEATPADRVSFHIHRWYLEHYIRPGDRVLEIGAGPGRFTIELARLGARITVGDISPRQLDLNRIKVREAGVEDALPSGTYSTLSICPASQMSSLTPWSVTAARSATSSIERTTPLARCFA